MISTGNRIFWSILELLSKWLKEGPILFALNTERCLSDAWLAVPLLWWWWVGGVQSHFIDRLFPGQAPSQSIKKQTCSAEVLNSCNAAPAM